MGYGFNGICHQDTASALAAFQVGMTAGDAAGITSFTAVPTINGTGLVTWSISHRPLTGTAPTTRTGTTQLASCGEGVSQWSVPSVLWVAVLFFSFVAGFRTGFRP